MCDVVEGGKRVFRRYGVRWRKILKFILQRQFLRRDICPNQILVESSAFVKGMMNLEVESAVERFSAWGEHRFIVGVRTIFD
jgi:hypothetical protein